MRPQSRKPSSTGSLLHSSVLSDSTIDCKLKLKTTTPDNMVVRVIIKIILGSFLHKNPEDPTEVPNGFVSDINPVS